MPTVCSETCVGRLRYIGLMLYDADAVGAAAAVEDETDLYEAQLSVFLDPHDPHVVAAARAGRHPRRLDRGGAALADLGSHHALRGGAAAAPGVPHDADGLVHPAAVAGRRRAARHRPRRRGRGNLFGAVDALRIPVEYLAGLFTAGDPAPVTAVLRRLAAMRAYQRRINLGEERDESIAAAVGMTGAADGRHVPAAGHRQVRGALRHPGRARRGRRPAWRSWPPAAASTTRAGPAWADPARSARRPARRADRGGELPRAAHRQTRRRVRRPGRPSRAGSTCSTGTARAAPTAVPATRKERVVMRR